MAEEVPSNGASPPLPDELREYLKKELIGPLLKHVDEQVEARVAAAKSDPASVANILFPKIKEQLQPVVNDLTARLQALEGAVPPVKPPALSPAASESLGDKTSMVVHIADQLLDLAVTKVLPAITQWQALKRGAAYDLAWAQQLRQENPMMAQVLAAQLNPDPLAAQYPLQMMNAYTQGLIYGGKARLAATQARDGGAGWPATPGHVSSGGAPSLPAAATPVPSVASMSSPSARNGGAPRRIADIFPEVPHAKRKV